VRELHTLYPNRKGSGMNKLSATALSVSLSTASALAEEHKQSTAISSVTSEQIRSVIGEVHKGFGSGRALETTKTVIA